MNKWDMKYRFKCKFDDTDELILIKLSEGLTATKIAECLNLTPKVIRNRIMAIRFEKKAKNTSHLVAMFCNKLIIFPKKFTEQTNSTL